MVRRDERAVATQVGAILLLAVLVILFTIYQASIVPDHNKQVEFNHNDRVTQDLIDVRNTILETKQTGENGYVTVDLGTRYPPRIVALNPPAVTGTLRTTENTSMRVENADGDVVEVCPISNNTKFVEYSPGYSVYGNAPDLVYEHTVLYRQFGESNYQPVTSQRLIQGDRVNLVGIWSNYSETSEGAVSFESRAGQLEDRRLADPTITLETRLDEGTWIDLLDGEVDASRIDVTGGVLTVDLDGDYVVSCGPVAFNEPPAGGDRASHANEINPAEPGDVRLVGNEVHGSEVTLKFNNTADSTNFTDARINFYDGNANSAEIRKSGESISATLVVGNDFVDLDPQIELEGDGTINEVVLDLNQNPSSNDWFVVTFIFESGEQGLYFVGVNN